MKLPSLLVVAVLLSGCGGTNTPAEHPIEAPRSLADAPPPPTQTEAIPQFFLVEVSGAQVSAAGEPVDLPTLRRMAVAEANTGRVRGAALTLNDATTEEQALSVVRLLLESGFRHVVLSSRLGLTGAQPSTAALPAAAPAAAPSETREIVGPPAPSAEPNEPAPTATSAEGPPVEVKHMGLHIGGGPNDPEHHAVYAEPISRRFEDIRQCYTLVQDPKKASFGVDLLVPSKGGTAKIENYRTAIGGKDFHLCVLGVFGSIDFPPPGKATMVSYSVLFKPL